MYGPLLLRSCFVLGSLFYGACYDVQTFWGIERHRENKCKQRVNMQTKTGKQVPRTCFSLSKHCCFVSCMYYLLYCM